MLRYAPGKNLSMLNIEHVLNTSFSPRSEMATKMAVVTLINEVN